MTTLEHIEAQVRQLSPSLACRKQRYFARFGGSVFGSGLDLTGSENLSGLAFCIAFKSE